MCVHVYSKQVAVKHDSGLPPSFKSKLSKFLRENKPPEFRFFLRMEESESATPPTKRRRVSSSPVDRQQIARVPRGYTNDSHFPVLMLEDVDERCPHCFCRPCVISQPPDFLRGSAAAHIRNRSKRFNLYVKFWGLLSDVGLWYHPEYLVRKATITERDDPRDIMPECVKTVIKTI